MADPSTPSRRLHEPRFISPGLPDTSPPKLSFRNLDIKEVDCTCLPTAEWVDEYRMHVKDLGYQWVSNAYRAYKIFETYDKLTTKMPRPCTGIFTVSGFFFLFIHYSHATYQITARLCTVRFLSAVRAVAARCKLPSALRPGLSQEDVVRTEITKERKEERA